MRTLRVAFFALGVASLLAMPRAALAQTSIDAYYDFLMARHLEASGDAKGAQAQLEKAVAADSNSAEVRAELAAFYSGATTATTPNGSPRKRFSSMTTIRRRIAFSA
jgi:Tfp pilus assembly protein PilF